jgi:hypothetical protein
MFEPLGNSTVLPATGWHPEPRIRGTFSILSGCLITMSLCIWTSLHLNLPEHKREHIQKYRKLGWMILGLIAPEMVVWNAWEQRKTMKKLSKLMQEKGLMPAMPTLWMRIRGGIANSCQQTLTCLGLRAKERPGPVEMTPYRQYNDRVYPWTDVHSWFVLMGGMSFEDSAEEDHRFMPADRRRVNITMESFEYMLKMRDHLIPDISREVIQDRSKSDRLAKLLTCWQAGYFCIQCVFRLSQELSITLLELNVFAHALCALALFVIWSDKPRDVCEPTLIVGDEANDCCALFCLHVVGEDVQKYFGGYKIENSPEDPARALQITDPTTFAVRFDEKRQVSYGDASEFCSLKVLETYWGLTDTSKLHSNSATVTIDASDLRRLQRVSMLAQQEAPHSFRPVKIIPANMPPLPSCHGVARTKNWIVDIKCCIQFILDFDEDGGLERHHILCSHRRVQGNVQKILLAIRT